MSQQWIEGVKQERTGWRDQEISARHRTWGFNCPAVDLDFLVVEYNLGKPVALIEYKLYKAQVPELRHPTYRALACLADGYSDPLPFMVAFYWPGIWAFRVTPVNDVSKAWFRDGETLTEYDFVRKLYRMRRLVLTKDLEANLNRTLPANDCDLTAGPERSQPSAGWLGK